VPAIVWKEQGEEREAGIERGKKERNGGESSYQVDGR